MTMTNDQKTVMRIVIPPVVIMVMAFIWVGVKAIDLQEQLSAQEAKAAQTVVEQAQTNDVQEVEETSNPLGVPNDVLITIAGVMTNATPDEVVEAHDLIVKTISAKLGTNGLKVVYVDFQ